MSLQVLGRTLAYAARRSALSVQPARNASYLGSTVVDPLKKYPDVEVSRDPAEWRFVERLLPMKTVPAPRSTTETLPSGWRPTNPKSLNEPYFIGRSRNHQPSVYLKIKERGFQKFTIVKFITGDIWRLKEDLSKRIEERLGLKHGIHVNEMYGKLVITGDVYNVVMEFYDEKGF
ncbi:Hypothetical predicted protein [Cloeon dipterum]|uniref:Large ribosomal subunit protein mL49 n=1 Tax=Cloeon dipterum TaxID=197152 RepID=A0A8S1D6F2_9INSE|nr:Hypothetical predicted protein [Cloeon dipterum]